MSKIPSDKPWDEMTPEEQQGVIERLNKICDAITRLTPGLIKFGNQIASVAGQIAKLNAELARGVVLLSDTLDDTAPDTGEVKVT